MQFQLGQIVRVKVYDEPPRPHALAPELQGAVGIILYYPPPMISTEGDTAGRISDFCGVEISGETHMLDAGWLEPVDEGSV